MPYYRVEICARRERRTVGEVQWCAYVRVTRSDEMALKKDREKPKKTFACL